jgi:hypothetical protein
MLNELLPMNVYSLYWRRCEEKAQRTHVTGLREEEREGPFTFNP